MAGGPSRGRSDGPGQAARDVTMALPIDLTDTIRSRTLDGVNGLAMHVLEAGEVGRPCLMLLHGFPELA